MTNFTYPHVKVNTYANPHRLETGYVDDTTVLFVPFISKFGTANEIKKIYSLEEFQSEYGSLDYATQGQTALNIANWLTNGGTVYAYRIFNVSSTDETKYKAKLFAADSSAEYVVGGVGSRKSYFTSSSTGSYVGINAAGAQATDPQSIKYFRLIKSGESAVQKFAIGTVDGSGAIAAVQSAVEAEAKFLGDAYNTLSVKLKKFNSNYVSLSISIEGKEVESRQKISYEKLLSIGDSSRYLDSLTIEKRLFEKITAAEPEAAYKEFIVNVTENALPYNTSLDAAVKEFFNGELAREALGNRIENPVQLIFDAGFSADTKKAMADFIEPSGSEKIREDIILILDCKVANRSSVGTYTGKKPEDITTSLESQYWSPNEGNIAIYAQACLIEEGTYAGKDIWVTPTYFLSMLMPYNDALYGIQYPVAGLTRGKINGVKAIDENPTPTTKQDYFDARINYIEKDSRGMYFMSQRTHDQASSSNTETALSFLNNARVKNQMVQELERLGREYLFEFNDATTLSNMSSVLNKYVNTWVQNRTLSFANVVVTADEDSNETVNIDLNMQFTGTIEIININIEIA